MKNLNHQNLRLSPEHLDAIRASVDWHALFSGIGLKRVDAKSRDNDWWSLSPFKPERTASFHMGPGGIWYDFSISEGGGAIELIQKIEGCNCFEAAHILLDRGWATSPAELSTVEETNASTRTKVERSIDGSCKDQLKGSPNTLSDSQQTETTHDNKPIRQNLIELCTFHEMIKERGISAETCDLLGIGYLPQGRSPLKDRIIFQVADARVTPKSKGERTRVILSHLGRATGEKQDPKYLFYEGFHKSSELYAQELIWLHEDAAEQILETGHMVLTEGPFDVAKAVEAGLRNIVGSFGASLSKKQAQTLKAMSEAFGSDTILILYDRDEAGLNGAQRAVQTLTDVGLTPRIFDWAAPIARTSKGDVFIPKTIRDLAEFSSEQISWLRGQKFL